jgi:hypothetical protein
VVSLQDGVRRFEYPHRPEEGFLTVSDWDSESSSFIPVAFPAIPSEVFVRDSNPEFGEYSIERPHDLPDCSNLAYDAGGDRLLVVLSTWPQGDGGFHETWLYTQDAWTLLESGDEELCGPVVYNEKLGRFSLMRRNYESWHAVFEGHLFDTPEDWANIYELAGPVEASIQSQPVFNEHLILASGYDPISERVMVVSREGNTWFWDGSSWEFFLSVGGSPLGELRHIWAERSGALFFDPVENQMTLSITGDDYSESCWHKNRLLGWTGSQWENSG